MHGALEMKAPTARALGAIGVDLARVRSVPAGRVRFSGVPSGRGPGGGAAHIAAELQDGRCIGGLGVANPFARSQMQGSTVCPAVKFRAGRRYRRVPGRRAVTVPARPTASKPSSSSAMAFGQASGPPAPAEQLQLNRIAPNIPYGV